MYQRLQWDVLLVDDDPDVLAVSKLALKSIKIFGIPLKVSTCASKAEGLAYLKNAAELPDLSLAIIDVVMESQHAGLDLCEYIRTTMQNRVTPIIIRTGQAGLAPERTVVDKYDITAYITKVEATDDRLYTLVKSSIRNFLFDRTSEGAFAGANHFVDNSSDRASVLKAFHESLQFPLIDKGGEKLPVIDGHIALIADGEAVGVGDYADPSAALALDSQLAGKEGREYPNGTFVREGDLVRLTPHTKLEGAPQVSIVARINFQPCPEFYVRIWLNIAKFVQSLLHRVG